jgi:transcription antitermination factor NusG
MWYVLRTAPGRQSMAIEELEAIGLDVIAPVMRKEIKHYQTKKWMLRRFPIFSQYLFAALNDDVDFDCLRAMDHVVAILGGSQGPIAIPTAKVIELCDAQNRGDFDVMRPPTITELKPDARVLIQSGPLAGFYANVVKAKGKKAVKAVVESLEGMREIELSIANLKLVA